MIAVRPFQRLRKWGFTLVELMTAIVVVGIGASLAVPAFGGYLERSRTRSGLDRLVADVSFARLHAIQNGRRTAVRIVGDHSYTIDTLGTGGGWGPIRTVGLAAEYPGVLIGGGETVLEFSSRGLLVNQTADGFIKVFGPTSRDSVFISPAGRVYRDF